MLDDLNAAQREAVLHRGGPLLVFAGAGSGKTRVITRRIAHAIEQRWYAPQEVVALTFTNKAAKEMTERVAALLGGGLHGITVGTFHSTCAKWLRFYGPRFGHAGDFVIYDSGDQATLVRRMLSEIKNDQITAKQVAQRIDRAKNHGLSPQQAERMSDDELGRIFPELYARYEAKLQQANALDFGDLVLHMVRMLENSAEARTFFQSRFRMVLVDEYQDTNAVQYRLLRALSPPPSPELCVVGDDDQSIYRFRGADVGNILAFRRDFPHVNVVKLEENYRSLQSILDVSNAVIKNNRTREPKALHATRGEGELPEMQVHVDEREEAVSVARAIEAHVRGGGKLEDVAVLFRQNSQSRVLEEVFSRFRLPFLLVGGQRFYERAEVKDALAYLRLLVRPESDIDLERVINTPARGIGEKTIERIAGFAALQGVPMLNVVMGGSTVLAQAGLNAGTSEKIAQFAQIMRRLRDAYESSSPATLMVTLMNESGLLKVLQEDESVEAEARAKNLEELVNAVAEWSVARPDATIANYLEELALINDVDQMKAGTSRVTLMTLHSAKGLEFRRVFLIGLEDGVFPVQRADGSDNDIEEERRLFYVGVTRAMDRLTMSACMTRMLYGQRKTMEPSRFLLEIPKDMLRKASVATPSNREEPRRSGPHPALGRSVRHATFGEGKVVDVSNDAGKVKYVVTFPGVGTKTVLAQFLELR